ncbi:hypothetical protein PULV_b0220 [Pseudoalteromonas ulvae UL12]|nr:hypothetical protein [Pseudoalteromonas ulvae UL12]
MRIKKAAAKNQRHFLLFESSSSHSSHRNVSFKWLVDVFFIHS